MGKLRLRTSVRLASVLLLATLGAACQDSPTLLAPVQRPTPGIARFDQGQHLGQTPFFCTLGRSAPSSPTGWQTRRLTIFIPRGELDEAGRTVRYEYRRPSSDGRSLTTALCTVPYTEGALRRVDRTLGVEGSGGAEQFRARQEMVTIQGGCVTSPDSVCPVDPIIVIAPPKDRTKEVQCPVLDPNCGSTGGDDGWGDGSWGGGGGGDSPDGGLSSEDDTPPDESPVCSQPTLTAWEQAACSALPPTEESDRLRKTVEAINRIRSRGGRCAEIAEAATNLLNGGTFRYYTWRVGMDGGYGNPSLGVIISYDWVDRWATANTGETRPSIPNGRNLEHMIVHEVEHALGIAHTTFNGAEDPYNTPNSRTCSGL